MLVTNVVQDTHTHTRKLKLVDGLCKTHIWKTTPWLQSAKWEAACWIQSIQWGIPCSLWVNTLDLIDFVTFNLGIFWASLCKPKVALPPRSLENCAKGSSTGQWRTLGMLWMPIVAD